MTSTHKIYGYRWLGVVYATIEEARERRDLTIRADGYFRWVHIQQLWTDRLKDENPLYQWVD